MVEAWDMGTRRLWGDGGWMGVLGWLGTVTVCVWGGHSL